ncbi:MAG: hypothetical protein QOG27_1740, partial [Verrucomicrobiota bacterium]
MPLLPRCGALSLPAIPQIENSLERWVALQQMVQTDDARQLLGVMCSPT